MVFDVIRGLMAPPEPNKRKIGFLVQEQQRGTEGHKTLIFDVSGIPKNVVRTVLVFRARFLGGNRNEKRRGPGCIQAGASVSAQNLLDDERLSKGRDGLERIKAEG